MAAVIPKSSLEAKASYCAVRFVAKKVVKVTARTKNMINYDDDAEHILTIIPSSLFLDGKPKSSRFEFMQSEP